MTENFTCGRFVAGRIARLLGTNPGSLSPTSRAMLAQLRQAASAEPGTVPAIWSLTAEGIPEMSVLRLDRTETAIHIALTQFAVHQQARQSAMHQRGQAFGSAVRKLADRLGDDPYETPVYRRFTALATASTVPALLAHSRGIITQLRGEEIPFDYARYADDLYWFLTPGHQSEARRRWGRDFHRFTSDTTSDSTTEGAIQ